MESRRGRRYAGKRKRKRSVMHRAIGLYFFLESHCMEPYDTHTKKLYYLYDVEGPAMDIHIQFRYSTIPVPLCVDRAKSLWTVDFKGFVVWITKFQEGHSYSCIKHDGFRNSRVLNLVGVSYTLEPQSNLGTKFSNNCSSTRRAI
eukprot:SAG31_NODE_7645_length_1632_cov_1.858355_3_plen_145_part_00